MIEGDFSTHAMQGALFGTAKRRGRVRLVDGREGILLHVNPVTRVCKVKVWTRHLRVPASQIGAVEEPPVDGVNCADPRVVLRATPDAPAA